MNANNRREFLADVGRAMLLTSVGPALASDLGLASALAAEGKDPLTFGKMEPLVRLMQETPAARIVPVLVEQLNKGTDLRTLVSAGALANARTFGGQDYIGFHTFMALPPALEMTKALPTHKQALPVLKVLHRNTNRIQEEGGCTREVLHPVQAPANPVASARGAEVLSAKVHERDWNGAEQTLAGLVSSSPADAFNCLQGIVEDEVDVHRVVLAWRAWAVLDITGKDQALTMLRQSVRYCLNQEESMKKQNRKISKVREVLPRLLDQYRLIGKTPGKRTAEDAWVAHLCDTIYGGSQEQAADAVAQALAEGMGLEAVGEAISLAANMLVLRDPGRPAQWANKAKPTGSVHGDSVGVHASDSANAWRNIARVSNPRNAFASLIVGAYHTAGQAKYAGQQPYPWAEHRDLVKESDPTKLLGQTNEAIRAKEQARASALAERYCDLGHPVRPLLDLLLGFAVSEDGALHAEKYYMTVGQEYATTRPAFRNRQLVALARVTASEFGYPAPGYEEACRLLKV